VTEYFATQGGSLFRKLPSGDVTFVCSLTSVRDYHYSGAATMLALDPADVAAELGIKVVDEAERARIQAEVRRFRGI
jgi:hypothetical protein